MSEADVELVRRALADPEVFFESLHDDVEVDLSVSGTFRVADGRITGVSFFWTTTRLSRTRAFRSNTVRAGTDEGSRLVLQRTG